MCANSRDKFNKKINQGSKHPLRSHHLAPSSMLPVMVPWNSTAISNLKFLPHLEDKLTGMQSTWGLGNTGYKAGSVSGAIFQSLLSVRHC